jgi:hypothetical protein
MHSRYPNDFPIDPQQLGGTLSELLMTRGAAREVALLAQADVISTEEAGYDNWDGGIIVWRIAIQIPTRIYAAISQAERDESCKIILETTQAVSVADGHSIRWVNITASLTHNDHWRDTALTWLIGEGVNNQGRVRTDNIAAREVDGLLFRSQAEICLYRALKRAGVPFAPLPVFVRGGKTYQRIEPDFLIFTDRLLVVVEVDGDTVHRETPAEADQRSAIFRHEGAFIERVKASDCDNDEKANACVSRLLAIIAKLKTQR